VNEAVDERGKERVG